MCNCEQGKEATPSPDGNPTTGKATGAGKSTQAQGSKHSDAQSGELQDKDFEEPCEEVQDEGYEEPDGTVQPKRKRLTLPMVMDEGGKPRQLTPKEHRCLRRSAPSPSAPWHLHAVQS